MKKKKIFLLSLSVLILAITIFLIFNRDNFYYVGPLKLENIDCHKKCEILDSVYRSDQRIRMSDVSFEQFAKEDHRNQELAISIIEKCGMPSLKEVSRIQMDAIWLALQHTDKKHRIKYFPLIEEAVNAGDLSKQQYALMKDRILVDDGLPQLYGTQIVKGKLYKLEAPESVNERRRAMDMEPIEVYLRKHYNIEYTPNL